MKKTLLTLMLASMFALTKSYGQPCTVTIMSTQLSSGCDSLWVQFTDSPACAPWYFLWSTGETSQSIIACAQGVYSVIVFDNGNSGCCSTMTDTITANPGFPTGIEDINPISPANIFPNPSTDGIFNLTFTGNGNMPDKIYVLNVDGRKIMDVGAIHESPLQSPAAINHIINLQSRASGIYFLVMEGEKGRRVMKLVR